MLTQELSEESDEEEGFHASQDAKARLSGLCAVQSPLVQGNI